jgi:beta-glucosidase
LASVPSFPPGFRFGAATAAYQIEGAAHEDGRGDSIWDSFCRVPGVIDNGDTGDVACDHYHRWREDLDLMAALGLETYRFSISWPRVQPDGAGALNSAGVRFYRELVEGLLERGIEPAATLYHWDLPQPLQDAGGWANRDTAERFAEYAQHMARELGDLVTTWITHNEPWVVTFPGHAQGRFAPGLRDWPTALAVSHHLLLSHGLAMQALPGSVGITLNLTQVYPAAPGEEEAARLYDGHLNRWFLDPVLRGSYPEDLLERYAWRVGPIDAIRDGDLDIIARPIAFLGVNYYFPTRVRADGDQEPLGVALEPGPPPLTAMGWEVEPQGLYELLVRLNGDYGVPISITENGAAFDDPPALDGVVEDPERVAYFEGHIDAVARAIGDGVDVRSYFAWSLMDNFEWSRGYAKRFGIVRVDYETQRRTIKRSGEWYRDLIACTREARQATP